MTIKQKVASGVAAVLATAGIAGSVWVGDRYEVEQNTVTTDLAEGAKTVLIVKGEDPRTGEIVYVDTSDDVFGRIEEFKLKEGVEPGRYTMFINRDGKVIKKGIYIGKSLIDGTRITFAE